MFVPKGHRVDRVEALAPTPSDRLLDLAEQDVQAAVDESGKIAAYLELADKVLDPEPEKTLNTTLTRPFDSAA